MDEQKRMAYEVRQLAIMGETKIMETLENVLELVQIKGILKTPKECMNKELKFKNLQ